MAYPFIQSANYTRSPQPGRKVRLVVLHTMEFPNRKKSARDCANWFGNADAPAYPAPQASPHYCVDDDEIIQCVNEDDVAWHCGTPNSYSIGIEMAGYAHWTASDWDAHKSMLDLVAMLVAEILDRYNLPTEFLSVDNLHMNFSGITTHNNVSLAFKGTHTDPGPNFPMTDFLDMVESKRNPYT